MIEDDKPESDYDLLEDEPVLQQETAHDVEGEPTVVSKQAGQAQPDPMHVDPVHSEIQEFLRKIEQSQQKKVASQPQQPPTIELTAEDEVPAKRTEVGALSHKHLAKSQLAEQAAHLGERIAKSDDRLDARLHKKFDHQMGQFQRGQATGHQHEDAKKGEPSAAARVAKMLTTPAGMRDAVVLNEILRRPAD